MFITRTNTIRKRPINTDVICYNLITFASALISKKIFQCFSILIETYFIHLCSFLSTTGFFNASNPVILHSTSSPSFMWTALGVPVESMSPGRNFITFEWNDTRKLGGNVIFDTVFAACTRPFITVATSSFITSSTSSGVTKWGPKLKNVSKLFTLVRYLGFLLRISSAVISSMVVYPATQSSQSSFSMFSQALPKITPSSASAVVLSDWRGIFISSPIPIIVVEGLKKLAGSVLGAFSDKSAA